LDEIPVAQLSIQIHPHRCIQLDLPALLAACQRLASEQDVIKHFTWREGYDDHAYVNLAFNSEHPAQLWRLLTAHLFQSAAFACAMRACAIAVCEGSNGWDDYLLLHHFDSDQVCDQLSADGE